MNIYSGRLHDDLQLFPEWELVVAYFHHIFDKLSILKHVKVISIPTPYQQSAPPALLVPADGNSSQKEPLLTKKLSLFHESL